MENEANYQPEEGEIKITIKQILARKSNIDLVDILLALRQRKNKELSEKEIKDLLNKTRKYCKEQINSKSEIEKELYYIQIEENIDLVKIMLNTNFSNFLAPNDVKHSLILLYRSIHEILINLLPSKINLNEIIGADEGSSVLKREEIGLLFILMKKHCIIDSEIDKSIVALIIEKLTGFKAPSMTTVLSDLEKDGVYRIEGKKTLKNLEEKINLLLSNIIELKKSVSP